MISSLQIFKYGDIEFRKLKDIPFEYYMPQTELSENNTDTVSLKELNYSELAKLNGKFTVGNGGFYFDSKEIGQYYSYNKELLDIFPLHISRGHTFSYDSHSYIEAIALEKPDGIKLNEIFDIGIIQSGVTKKVKVKLVGVLQQPAMVLDFNSGGDISFSNLFQNIRKDETDAYTFIFNENDLKNFDITTIQSDNELLLFDSNITPQEYAQNKKILFKTGNTINYTELKENQDGGINYTIEKYVPVFLFALIISVMGMIGVNIINTTENLKTYNILFICGLKWQQCIGITVINTARNIVYAGIPISVVLFLIRYNLPVYGTLYFTYRSFLYCWIILILYACISLLAPLIILKRCKPSAQKINFGRI